MNNLVFNTIATLIQLSMALLGSEDVEEIKDNEDVVALVNEFLLLNDKNDDVSQRHRSIILNRGVNRKRASGKIPFPEEEL